jgi:hypothetical protein
MGALRVDAFINTVKLPYVDEVSVGCKRRGCGSLMVSILLFRNVTLA